MIFANKGWENTPEAARLACDYAREHGIKHVVIASKTGYTTDIFMDTFAKAGVDVHFVNVTHCYGDLGPGQCEMTPEKRRELTDKGVTVITATHALSGAERGIVNKYGGVTPAILMADTLKMLGQGMKVGVEISLMAMDNGAVPYGEEILAVGGCGHGADYVISLIPGHSNNLFETVTASASVRHRYHLQAENFLTPSRKKTAPRLSFFFFLPGITAICPLCRIDIKGSYPIFCGQRSADL